MLSLIIHIAANLNVTIRLQVNANRSYLAEQQRAALIQVLGSAGSLVEGARKISVPKEPSSSRPSSARVRSSPRRMPSSARKRTNVSPDCFSVTHNQMARPQPLRAAPGGFRVLQHPAASSVCYEETVGKACIVTDMNSGILDRDRVPSAKAPYLPRKLVSRPQNGTPRPRTAR